MSTPTSLPIAGWEGKIEASLFKKREDGTVFTVEGQIGSSDVKEIALVQNVRATSSFSILREAKLGSRIKVVIPTPVEFSGSFDIINSENNSWLFDLLLGDGDDYKPIYCTLTAANSTQSVGVVFDECYLTGHDTTIAANGTMRTRFEFVALEMSKSVPIPPS